MNNLRYLSPKSPFSERGLAIALPKSVRFFYFMLIGLSIWARLGGVFYNTLVINNLSYYGWGICTTHQTHLQVPATLLTWLIQSNSGGS
jgi:hypothetical protein